MTKTQYALIAGATILFLGLYFGFDTKTHTQRATEQSRALTGESSSVETLLAEAKQRLSPDQTAQIGGLEQTLQQAATDSEKVALLKQLSGLWYRFGELPLAGVMAEEVALLENADTAWSVAGALFFSALNSTTDPVKRTYCADHAVKAFENAASLKPENVEHRVNLALVYAENPPPDNPMKAVLMLRDLESKHPDQASVYNALGRLAIKTGQWQRAVDRLEKSWSLDKTNANTPCLLAKAYEGVGNTEKAQDFKKRCK